MFDIYYAYTPGFLEEGDYVALWDFSSQCSMGSYNMVDLNFPPK